MATYRTSATGGASSGTSNRNVTIVPAVGDLILAYICVANNTNDTPTCSDDNGGTYDLVDVMNATITAISYRMAVFVRTALMTNTTSTIITFATGSNSSGATAAIAITNMTQAGSKVIRSKGSQNNQAAATPAPALNQTSLTSNLTIVACGSADTTTTEPSGWVERVETSQTADVVALEIATRNSGFAGTTITFGAACSTVFCSHALEINAELQLLPTESLNFWADGTPRNIFDYGVRPSDNLNNWADTHAESLGGSATPLTQTASDSLNNWQDACTGTRQPRWLDTHAENLAAGGGGPTPLTQSASDSLNNWQDALVGDTLDRWRDSSATALGSAGVTPLTQSASDSLNNWQDALVGDNLNRWRDSVSVTIPAGAGALTKSVSDSINFLADDTSPLHEFDYFVQIFEDLNNWADVAARTLSGPAAQTLSRNDSLNFWADAVTTSLSTGPALTKSVSDSLNFWADSILGDNLNRWQDAATVTRQDVGATLITKTAGDSLNFWADTQRLGYGLLPTESINNWLDATAANRLPVLLTISQTDSLNFWLDTHNKTLFGALISLQQTDSINNWSDAPRVGSGLRLADNLNNWNDAATVTRLPIVLSLTRADSLNFWADLVATIPSANYYFLALWIDVALLTLATTDTQITSITTTDTKTVSAFPADTATTALKYQDSAIIAATTKDEATIALFHKDERSI